MLSSCVCAQITLHTRKIPSHSSKKSRPLWPVMIDDNTPTHESRKLVKTYKNLLPRKRILVAEVCGETYFKNDKKMEKKNGHKRRNQPRKLKGNRSETDIRRGGMYVRLYLCVYMYICIFKHIVNEPRKDKIIVKWYICYTK